MTDTHGVIEFRLSKLEQGQAETNAKIDRNHTMASEKFDRLTDSVAILLDRSASAERERLARMKRDGESEEVTIGGTPRESATDPRPIIDGNVGMQMAKAGGIIGALWVVFNGLDKVYEFVIHVTKLGGK